MRFPELRWINRFDTLIPILLAILTLGEGWHNHHHHYAVSARQGFMGWELDITYGLLVLFSWLGVVRDLRQVPQHVLSNA
jgi:stearoyl-CoA desaturase (delta-9 desaturase)